MSAVEPALLVVLLLVGFAVGRAQSGARAQNRLDPVSAAGQLLLAPVATRATALLDGVTGSATSFLSGPRLQAENRALRDRVGAAAMYEERIADLENQLEDARQARGLAASTGRLAVSARIVGYAASEGRLTLDRGSRAGIGPGMPVIVGEGLLGTVQTVGPDRAGVLFLASPSLRIGAMDLSRSPTPVGLAQGTGDGDVEVTFFDSRVEVAVGDVIATSGFSSRIPRGLVIGRVARVEASPEYGIVRAIVSPEAAVGRATDVTVLR